MIKLRLELLPEQAEAALARLRQVYNILQVRGPYPNRASAYVRYYVEVDDYADA